MTPSPSQILISAIAWTAIHSLWQGPLIAFGAFTGRRYATKPSTRALIVLSSIALFVFAQSLTLALIIRSPQATFAAPEDLVVRSLANVRPNGLLWRTALPTVSLNAWMDRFDSIADYLASAWLIALIALLSWSIAALSAIRREVQRARPLAPGDPRCAGLAERLGIGRMIRFGESSATEVPMTAGFFRPAVLLPSMEILPLNERQSQAMVLHELAHVRRNDFFWGLFATLLRALYCFNPAIVFLYRRWTNDIEEAADEVAAAAFGDKCEYAEALLAVAASRSNSPLRLGANGGSLRDRIRRVLHPQYGSRRRSLASVLGSLCAGLLGLSVAGQVVGSVAADRRNLHWVNSHSLGAAIVSTLSSDSENPEFGDALRACIREIKSSGAPTESSLNRFAAAALQGAPSDLFYRDLCECRMRRGRHDFGDLGTEQNHYELATALLGDLSDERRTRAALILAGVCVVHDSGILSRKLLWRSDVTAALHLSPSEFYRLQLAATAQDNRLQRMAAIYDRIYASKANESDFEDLADELAAAPASEALFAASPSLEFRQRLIETSARRNGHSPLTLMQLVTVPRLPP